MARKGNRPEPGSRNLALAPLIGAWTTQGSTIATATEPAVQFSGTDSYEWLENGFFVLHRVDVVMGDKPVVAIEIIHNDPAGDGYQTFSVDAEGNTSTYQARLDGDRWSMASHADRFHGSIAPDRNRISGRWERKTGAGWEPWMDVTLTKTS